MLIDIFDTNLKRSLTNFISFSSSETLKQSLKISFIYVILTTFIFILLSISGVRIFDSFNLSLTLISSGGFLPDNNLSLIINGKFQQIILSVSMLLSFFSLFLIYNLASLNRKKLSFLSEDFNLLIYLIFLISFSFVFLNSSKNFPTILVAITSSISNTGISFNDTPNNLIFIFFIMVVVGGSFF